MRTNRLREIWAEGRGATNCWLSIPSQLSAETMAHQGWDSVTVDLQHGPIDYAMAYAMLVAISTTDAVPLARVPWNEPGAIMRMLDWGAYGVVCPNIETAEECARFVGAARYTPMGYRSVGSARAMFYAGRDYVAKANETVLTIAQIESKKALDNVEAIARTPGLDMLYVGPNELGLSLGRAAVSNQTDPVVVAAIDKVRDTAHAAGLRAGIYCGTADHGLAMIKKGFDLVTVVNDAWLLRQGEALRAKFT